MAVEQLDNPAGRLASLLSQLHEMFLNRGNLRAWDAWADLLCHGCDPDDPKVLERFTEVRLLPGQMRAAVDSLDGVGAEQKQHLLEHLPRIEKALNTSGHRSVALRQVLEEIATGADVPGSAALQSLRTCSLFLSQFAAEHVPSTDDLEKISDAVNELIESVVASTVLDRKTKQLFLTHLRAVSEAVQNIRVTGQAGIEQATERLFGFLMLRPAVLARLSTVREVLSGLIAFFTVAGEVLALEPQAQQVVSDAIRMITRG